MQAAEAAQQALSDGLAGGCSASPVAAGAPPPCMQGAADSAAATETAASAEACACGQAMTTAVACTGNSSSKRLAIIREWNFMGAGISRPWQNTLEYYTPA